MSTIRLIQSPYLTGTNEHPYYTATAIDNSGESYTVVWEISNHEAFESGDEDCCNWDSYTVYRDGYPSTSIDAKVIWK